MKPSSPASGEAAATPCFDAREIAERKAFLEFTSRDCDRLRQLHDSVGPAGMAFSEAFYSHLLSFEPMRRLIPDQRALDSLHEAQSEYFSGLTAGDYGDAYVANRLRVGQVHNQIGLEPKWYIGAYRKYLSGLMPLVWEQCDGDSNRFLVSYDSLLKIVLFDMGLALDSYFLAERRVLQEMKNYADRVICTMPSGLLVLDTQLCLRTINLAGREMLGLLELEPATGRHLGQLLVSSRLLALAREVLEKQQATRSLVIGPLPELDGRVLALTLSATLIDEAPALIVQLENVTESVRTKERLARFRTALDASDDAIYLIDRARMRFVDVNQTACKQMGYSRVELLSMAPQDIKPLLEERDLARKFDQILADTTRAGRIETLHQRKDGSTFPVEVALRGFVSEGRPMLVAVARDISQRKQAEAELKESEERFRATFQQAAVGIAHVAADGRWLRVNEKLSAIVGYSREELLRLDFQSITHPDDLSEDLEYMRQVLNGEIDSYRVEKRYLHKDGGTVWAGVTVSLVRTPGGQPKYFISVIEDISARKQTEESLLLAQRALEASGNGIVITDCRQADNPIVYVNPAFERITGYQAAEALGRNCRFLHGEEGNQAGTQALSQAVRDSHEAKVVVRNYRKDGRPFWNELLIAPVRAEDGTITHFVGVQNDITLQKQAEENLLHMATHDALTGLPNRSLLQDRIGQAIGHANRERRGVAVLFIDIDRFKNINDSLGHTTGDALITTLARRLRDAVRMVDTVARVGGDEFVVVLTDVSRESDITQIIPNLLAAVTQPVAVEGHELSVTASIGISLYPRDGKDVMSLLKNADTAMYRAKDAGRNGFRFYTQEMNADAVDRLRLENDLRKAIQGNELVVYYQPQVDAETGRIVAAEALLRWRHPSHGLVAPNEFIPLAEETGLIVPIGEWVLRSVCAQLRGWREAGLPEPRIAVNLSPRQFRQPDIVEMIAAAARDYGLPSQCLELEITEGSLMHNPDEAAILLSELSRRGFSLAVDDFGTGYSSLAYLKRFPLHALKIDRSFVGDIESNRDSAAIATAVIALAHSLGLKVVAEGVEQEVQMEFLRGLKCDFAQGYLYGRPLPAEDFMALLEKQKCLIKKTPLGQPIPS
ncbi:MAG: PAS domain S-box protein [Gallionellaceae bacterium]|nr:PAS domain S-box protein [Gallionellaceae bacterium]